MTDGQDPGIGEVAHRNQATAPARIRNTLETKHSRITVALPLAAPSQGHALLTEMTPELIQWTDGPGLLPGHLLVGTVALAPAPTPPEKMDALMVPSKMMVQIKCVRAAAG